MLTGSQAEQEHPMRQFLQSALSAPPVTVDANRHGGIDHTVVAARRSASWDFSRPSAFGGDQPNGLRTPIPVAAPPRPSSIQRKLAIGRTNDPLELEADRVAEQVMRMPDPSLLVATAPLQISRKCAECEEEDERTKQLQMKPATESPAQTGQARGVLHDVLRSHGQPLDAAARAYFEPRFGQDFSDVPLHTDDRAAESAVSIGASAYTAGSHIAFATGPAAAQISRKCSARKEDQSPPVKTKRAQVTDGPGDVPDIVHEVLSSPGQPLSTPTRVFFEPRFGVDFSDVRLHTGSRAADSALAMGALAYTAGSHIVLGTDQSPSQDGPTRMVLAHELAHVVQQSGLKPAPNFRAGTAPVQRTSTPLVQRAMRKGCIAPSFVVNFATASVFGAVAEALIEADYLAIIGGIPFADVFLDNPLGPISYVAFLVSHHPTLDEVLLAIQIGLSGGVLVPDILDTRAPLEFYDVKPDSPDGRALGRGKLSAIDAFMAFNKLPYIRGTSYTPTPSLPIPLAGPALIAAITAIAGPGAAIPALACGTPILTLAPKRAASGLLLYQICVEADLDCYLKVLALEALIAAIIAAAIVTGGGSLPETAPALGPAVGPLFGI